MSTQRRVAIIGTGTGVGKTHLGVALLRALAAEGLSVAGLKPIESGVGAGVTDAQLLDAASTFHVKHSPPFAFAAPVSPHLAAEREGMAITLAPVMAWVALSEAAWTLIETAGGLLSPISLTLTNLDLVAALQPDAVVLVAPDRLGVLHDVSATLFAYRKLAPQLPEPVLVLQAPALPDESTTTNPKELIRLGVTREVITFLRAEPNETPVIESATTLARRLGAIP